MTTFHITTRSLNATSREQVFETRSLAEAIKQIVDRWTEDGPEAWTFAFTVRRDGAEHDEAEVAREFRHMAEIIDLQLTGRLA